MCYTEIKLGNKTNKNQDLTNKNKNIKNKKEQKMAEKLGGSEWSIPNNGKVVDSDWKDDIATDDDFELYDKEKEYVSPDKVVTKNEQKRIDRIKNKKIGATISEILKLQVA